MKVNWQSAVDNDTFESLKEMDCFKINTSRSKGAVYMKVRLSSRIFSSYQHGMLELASGKVYPPECHSPVKKVDVVVNIDSPTPRI